MSSTLTGVHTPSDAELISAVRGGDTDAYGELFQRHVDSARRLARQLTTGPDVDDLVSEAFAKVLTRLQRGGGPELSFRAYLLTAIRRLHVDRFRSSARLEPTADLTPFDPGVPFRDPAVEGFENAAAARAFASLPERWQMVLWHTAVEGQRPAEVAPLLGLSPNSVSALAYRAREGLRQAYLSMHAQDTARADCAWTHDHLGAYVRGGLSRRDAARVEEHLGGCHRCAAVWLELDDLNRGLAGLLAPLLLGTAAAGYVGARAAGVSVGTGLAGLATRLRDLAASHAPATVATGLALGAGVVGGVLLWPQHPWSGPRPADDPVTGSIPGQVAGQVTSPRQGARLHRSADGSAPPTDGLAAVLGGGSAVRSERFAAPSPSSSATDATPPRGKHHQLHHQPGRSDDPEVDLEVRVNGLPPGGSTGFGVAAETGVLGDHPVRRRIVVGPSG